MKDQNIFIVFTYTVITTNQYMMGPQSKETEALAQNMLCLQPDWKANS